MHRAASIAGLATLAIIGSLLPACGQSSGDSEGTSAPQGGNSGAFSGAGATSGTGASEQGGSSVAGVFDPSKVICTTTDGKCECKLGGYSDQESEPCNIASVGGAVCSKSEDGSSCACKTYGCIKSCLCDGGYDSAPDACPASQSTHCVKGNGGCWGQNYGCDSDTNDVMVASCDADLVLPIIACTMGHVQDCSAAMEGNGTGGLPTDCSAAVPPTCKYDGNQCSKPEDCCGHETGAETCFDRDTDALSVKTCTQTCQSDAECGNLCCNEFLPGEKSCGICPKACTSGDSSVHVPKYAKTSAACAGCLQTECCSQLHACDLDCFKCALNDESCPGNASFSGVVSCMAKSCAAECAIQNCNDSNCTGCISAGGETCCNVCKNDSCDYQCTF